MLVALYNATNGDHWTNNHNWTRDVDLDEWHGVTTDPSGRIVLELDLEENELFGTLPPELGDLSNLRRLGLGDNQLQGEIPSELGNLAELRYLSLTRNLLRGEIPWELGNLTYLEVLGLGGNALEGEIPSELGNLANLRELYLWGNRLRGEIPPDLGNLSALEKLLLQDNLLEGSIPLELGDLTNLKELDLSENAALSGCMPEGSPVGFCTSPTNIQMRREEARTIVLTWDPVEGASHYRIYHDDYWACSNTFFCDDVVGSEVFETTFTHTGADRGMNNYAILACSGSVCSSRGVIRGNP